MEEYPDISQLIIDNFTEVIKRIPMKFDDRRRILRLVDLCVERLGKEITADAIYPEEDSNPEDYNDEWEMIYNEEI